MQHVEPLTGGWPSVSGLWKAPYGAHCPSSWNHFICIRTFFLEPSNARRGTGTVQDCACQDSPRLLGKETRCWASPFPGAIRCGSDELTVICLSGRFVPFKGAGWHVRGSLQGRNLQVVRSSSASCHPAALSSLS